MDPLSGSGLPTEEQRIIVDTARRYGVDPAFLAAIRKTENGGPGREFGVLSVAAPTYQDQANVAAQTIANTLNRYRLNTGQEPIGADGKYTSAFTEYFSRGGPGYAGYAPLGALNDLTGLNYNHLGNMLSWYGSISVIA